MVAGSKILEMLFKWTKEKLEWYARASRHTGFHRELAAIIRPRLRVDDSVTDFGCGPGLVALELAASVRSITAVDIDPYVVAHLRCDAEKVGIPNIVPMVADAADIVSSTGDVALICYYRGPGEWMAEVIRAAGRLVVVVMHASDPAARPSKISERHRRAYAAEMDEFLDTGGYSFVKTECALDFGQPFVSIEEARAFFEIYSGSEADSKRAYAEKKLSCVNTSDDPSYPYFFPSRKDVALYFIEAGNP